MDRKKQVRVMLLQNDLSQWQLADKLGISESTLSRRLRDLSDDEFERIQSAIEELKGEN